MNTNEKRGAIPQYLQGKYQSEHVRLDLETVQPGTDSKTPNAAVRTFKVTGNQKRTISPSHTVPAGKTLPAQVGNHEEQMWFDDKVAVSANPKMVEHIIDHNQYVDNNEYIDVEAMQTRKIQEESRPSYQEIEESQKTTSQADAIIKALNLTLSPGEFIVFCQEQVVVRTSNIPAVKEAIEELVLKNIPIEDIFVCKRLNINFGVLLDN